MCIHPSLPGVSDEISLWISEVSAVDALLVWEGFMQSVEGPIEQRAGG